METDVVVRLLAPTNAAQVEATPTEIRAHSHLLRSRSDFFAARLSDRWTPSRSVTNVNNTLLETVVDIVMHNASAADAYARCINIMASTPQSTAKMQVLLETVDGVDEMLLATLNGVDDALKMLHVTSELGFVRYTDACLQYLEMLGSWTESEEERIREAVDVRQLASRNADLTARLGISHRVVPADSAVVAMRGALFNVLRIARAHLHRYLDGRSSSEHRLKDIDPTQPVSQSEIRNAWDENVNLIKCKVKLSGYGDHDQMITWQDAECAASSLTWMLRQLAALGVSQVVVDAFGKDIELSSLIVTSCNNLSGMSFDEWHPVIDPLIGILITCSDLIHRGRVLLPRRSRASYIATWLPVLPTVAERAPRHRHRHRALNVNLDDVFKDLVKGVPIFDREPVIFERYTNHNAVCDDEGGSLAVSSDFERWCAALKDWTLSRGLLLGE